MEAAQMEDGGSNKAGICRQSSTRWTPTSDQIRILKELYYNNGVRSPSADQIQRICLQLRKYGKIEGKNVFYWFQNHKARERQKKRFTSDHHVPINVQRSGLVIGNTTTANNYTKPDDHYFNKYSTNSCQGVSSASAPSSVMSVNGPMGNYGGYGSMTMEKSFRDCSISAGTGTASAGSGGSIGHNFGSWAGSVDPYPPYTAGTNFGCNRTPFLEEVEEGEEEEEYHQEIETLPLFPMHAGDHIFGNMKATSDGVGGYGYCSGGWGGYNGASRTSLELSLNSYGAYNTANYY